MHYDQGSDQPGGVIVFLQLFFDTIFKPIYPIIIYNLSNHYLLFIQSLFIIHPIIIYYLSYHYLISFDQHNQLFFWRIK